jgi:DNA-binding transcriptional MerR regulator
MRDDTDGLDSKALIATAARAGYPVSPRMLQRWRSQGLLPPGRRAPGGTAIWVYPTGSERQLLRLLHWRSRSRSHKGILLALWVEGFPIELARVRAALPCFIDEWEAMADREIKRTGQGNTATAVAALGSELARMRSKAPLPHLARMSLAERERAYAYMAANMLGSVRELGKRDQDITALERLLGLRSGRDGGLSREVGLRDEKGKGDRLPTPAQARAAIAASSDEELELVRRGVWIGVTLLPPTLKALLAEDGPKALDLFDVIDHLFADPHADALALLVAMLLVAVKAQEATTNETREHLAALAPERIGPQLAALAGVDLIALMAGVPKVASAS